MRIRVKLAVALVSALALICVTAAAASAAEYENTAAGSATGLNHTFEVAKSEGAATVIKCTEAKFAWTQTGKHSTFTVTPTYPALEAEGLPNCTLAGVKAEVTNEGCTYEFGAPTVSGTGYSALVSVLPSTCKIKIVASTCTVTVAGGAANSGLSQVFAENTGTGSANLKVKAEVAKVAVTTNGGALCVTQKIPGSSTGTYKGEVTATGVKIK